MEEKDKYQQTNQYKIYEKINKEFDDNLNKYKETEPEEDNDT